jgi:hypothetical protein
MAKTVFKKIPSRKYYFQSFICSKLSEAAMGALTLHVCAPVIFITAAVIFNFVAPSFACGDVMWNRCECRKELSWKYLFVHCKYTPLSQNVSYVNSFFSTVVKLGYMPVKEALLN